MKPKKASGVVSQHVHWHTSLQRLAKAAREARKELPGDARKNKIMNILLSPEYHSLPSVHKLVVRKAVKGKDVFGDIAMLREQRRDVAAESKLLSRSAGSLSKDAITRLVLQLTPNKQKDVLFKMPGLSDEIRADIWKVVQRLRYRRQREMAKSSSKEMISRDPQRAIQGIAGQAMTLRPKETGKFLKELGLTPVQIRIVQQEIKSRRAAARAYNMKEKVGWVRTEYGWERNPLTMLPGYLHPMFRAFAKVKVKGQPGMADLVDFLEFLADQAGKRNMTPDQFRQRLLSDSM